MTTPPTDSPQHQGARDEPITDSWREVKREGSELATEAKQSAARAVEQQKSAAAGYMKGVLSALDSGARELDRQGYSGSASLTSKTAADLTDLVDRLSERPVGELLHELEDFARRRPALFLGAAFVAGFGGARFLKSSAPPGADRTETGEPVASAGDSGGDSGRTMP